MFVVHLSRAIRPSTALTASYMLVYIAGRCSRFHDGRRAAKLFLRALVPTSCVALSRLVWADTRILFFKFGTSIACIVLVTCRFVITL